MATNAAAMRDPVVPFDSGAATHVGKVRDHNEDNYLVRPEAGVWAVADGMGGHEAGDLASSIVVDSLKSIGHASSAAELLSWCEQRMVHANNVLTEIGRERGTIVGTTVAALLAFDSHFACVWSGDSRVYLVRDGAITPLSRDHSEVQELIAEGRLTPDEARTWSGSNVITRAIGVHDDPQLDINDGMLKPEDVFVLCSDGLTGHVRDSEILREVVQHAPQQACDALVALTLERGAADNVTVVVVRYQPNGAATAPRERSIWE